MGSPVIIEPEYDAGFAWLGTPALPRALVGGLGLVDDEGRPVEVFRATTERDVWRAAFAASTWRDFRSFRDRLRIEGCYVNVWTATCPGRTEPARWHMLIVPRDLLSPQRSLQQRQAS